MPKPKIKQRSLPVASQASTNAVDLFLLAGIPNPLHKRVGEFLQALAGSHSKVIATAFPSYDGALYRRESVAMLFNAGVPFAIRRLRNRSPGQTAQPRRLVLLYVPAAHDEILIGAFDFFAFPIPMRDLSTYDHAGTQRRHIRQECENAVRKAKETYDQVLVGSLQARLESRRSREPLLLPPVNFHLPKRPLKDAFGELTRGTRSWENPVPDEIAAETFDSERLPNFLRPQERQAMFKDARGIVYPCSRATEMHGTQNTDDRETLRSTYRFGVPLPPGFHHDAQLEYGRHFENTSFDCSQKGRCHVSGSHVNVYPNDFVRTA